MGLRDLKKLTLTINILTHWIIRELYGKTCSFYAKNVIQGKTILYFKKVKPRQDYTLTFIDAQF